MFLLFCSAYTCMYIIAYMVVTCVCIWGSFWGGGGARGGIPPPGKASYVYHLENFASRLALLPDLLKRQVERCLNFCVRMYVFVLLRDGGGGEGGWSREPHRSGRATRGAAAATAGSGPTSW